MGRRRDGRKGGGRTTKQGGRFDIYGADGQHRTMTNCREADGPALGTARHVNVTSRYRIARSPWKHHHQQQQQASQCRNTSLLLLLLPKSYGFLTSIECILMRSITSVIQRLRSQHAARVYKRLIRARHRQYTPYTTNERYRCDTILAYEIIRRQLDHKSSFP